MKNEITILIDSKLDIKDIEKYLESQLGQLEEDYNAKLSELNEEEKEYVKHCYERIDGYQKDIQKHKAWLEQRLAESSDETYREEILKGSQEYLQYIEDSLARTYEDAQRGYTEYKEYELQGFNEQRNNVALVFDMSKLGFSDDAFAYISNIVRQYNTTHDRAKLSLKLLPDDANINGKLPILVKTTDIKKILSFRDYVAKNQLSKNNDMGIRQIADENDCSIDSVISANALIDKVANEVTSMGLTPFETVLYVHKFCSQFYYNTEHQKSPRVFESIIENGGIVCVGYASFFKAICDKANVPGLNVSLNVAVRRSRLGGHANCRVVIDDPEYNVKGIYMEDPCYNAQAYDTPYNFSACMYSLQDIDVMHSAYYYSFDIKAGEYFKSNLDNTPRDGYLDTRKLSVIRATHKKFVNQGPSETIPIDTFRDGLKNMAIKTGMSKKDALLYAQEKILDSVENSVYLYKKGSINEFYLEAKKRGIKRVSDTYEQHLGKYEAVQTYADKNKQYLGSYLRG